MKVSDDTTVSVTGEYMLFYDLLQRSTTTASHAMFHSHAVILCHVVSVTHIIDSVIC